MIRVPAGTPVHHAAIPAWFVANPAAGWATCPITESGFVRVSSNPKVLRARSASRRHEPKISGHRQAMDAHLVTLASRHGVRLVTFDAAAPALADEDRVELLTM